jgi:recombination protein RecT
MAKTQQQAPRNLPATDATSLKFKNFGEELKSRMPYIQRMLPAHIKPEKFQVMVLTALQNNPKLLDCTVPSLLVAVREAAELGLSFSKARRECDIIPRWNGRDKCVEAQFQPRYGGLMALALRSGEVKSISSTAVRQGDKFVFRRGLNPVLEHEPILNNPGALIAAYCVWTLKDGTKEFEVVEQEDIDRAKKASQSRDRETGEMSGPWKDDEEEQWRKTAVRRASKYMPSSAEDFQRAVQIDTLRDIGHEVKFEAGEVVDVTEQGPVNTSEAAGKQLNALEHKIQVPTGDFKAKEKAPAASAQQQAPAPKPAQAPAAAAPAGPPINLIPMVKTPEGDSDYAAWVATCINDLQRAPDQAWRDRWHARHATLIEGGEFTAPDVMEPLIKALG